MWLNWLFDPKKDAAVSDTCPVCKTYFGTSYLKTVRVYYCHDCDKLLEFCPFEKIPKMVKLKRSSNLDSNYTPFEEDLRWMDLPDSPDDNLEV